MASINTVLGPLDVEKLGFTLMHEHVAIASAGVRQTYPELYGDRTALVEMAVKELGEAREGGVETIVDMTTMDLDRDVRLLEEVSRRSGVNVVAATGCWLDPPRALYYPGQYPGAPRDRPTWEARTETLARLIEAGVGDRLMLSHDWPMLAGFRNADLEDGRRRNPDGLLFISKRVLPRLRELGVSEDAITALMVDNPRRFLGA
jgi:predicted metal-dependent phosphotriesterase family hydrolase